ncbi:hypothetical protein [Alistipes ihumii]|uniref:hypothetical protein n=1 Tax=Alistipes ihumii TaxID=1470347 RepID=UPI002673901E|nr:hypothetical protein [Alistipes ihumii]
MNSVLDSAIAKSRILNSELGKVSRNASAGSRTRRRKKTGEISEEDLFKRYPHIRPQWQKRVSWANSFLKRHRGFNDKDFLRNFDRSAKVFNKFSSDFLRNSLTLYGMRGNFANAVKVVSSFSRTVGAAVPAIGTAGSIGKIALIGQGIPALAGGLGYWAGMRTLKSQSMQEAAANNMRYNMARHSLGEGYDDAFRAASDIAVSTGSSRVGTLDLISTLTGLNVGGKLLSQEQASYLANITAKLAHASNRDMGVVGLNMQQILTSWQGIDIKELTKSVPLIGKFLQDERRKAGSNEDIYAFVRSNPQAFFRALEEFNKTVKISPVAMARGQIALNRENFFLKLEKLFEPVAKRMANINTKLYDILGDVAEEFFSNQNLDNVDSILDNFQKASKTLLKAAAKFGNAAINVGSWMAENPWTTIAGLYALFGKGSLQMKVATIIAGNIIDGNKKADNKAREVAGKELLSRPERYIAFNEMLAASDIPASKYKETADYVFSHPDDEISKQLLGATARYIHGSSYLDRLTFRDKGFRAIEKEYGPWSWEMIQNALSDAWNMAKIGFFERTYIGFNGVPYKISPPKTRDREKAQEDFNNAVKYIVPNKHPEDQYKDSIQSLTDSFDTQSVGQSDTQTIRGMSGTTRALVINFNREIVSMPTTINANDVEDIKQQLEPAIEDMIVRGLTIALNNSTRMI